MSPQLDLGVQDCYEIRKKLLKDQLRVIYISTLWSTFNSSVKFHRPSLCTDLYIFTLTYAEQKFALKNTPSSVFGYYKSRYYYIIRLCRTLFTLVSLSFPLWKPELKSHLTTESLDGSNKRLSNTFLYLYAFFWVMPQRLEFICRRFGTLCLFHLNRQVDVSRHINSRRRGVTQKKA